MDNETKVKLMEILAKSGMSVGQLIIENTGTITYNDHRNEAKEEKDNEAVARGKDAIMEYVGRLKPVITENVVQIYDKMWLSILDLDEVKEIIYDRGRQKGTNFNRNFVANIIHMMVLDNMFIKGINDVQLTELLEPAKGKNHPVRNSLGMSPETKIKRAIEVVLKNFS